MTIPLLCCLLLAVMAGRQVPSPYASDDRCCEEDDLTLAGQEEGGGEPEPDTPSSAQPCPQSCQCYRAQLRASGFEEALLVVNCSGRGLVEFPAGLPDGTEVLDLSHNKLQNLSSLPYLLELKLLDLSSNWIRQLDNHWVFEHVSQLRSLSLADNAISVLQHGTFTGLGELRHLDISRNALKRIETHAFTGLPSLEVLHLESNQLFQLKRECLLAVTSLQRLFVGDNMISLLEPGVFGKLPDLQHLDLSDNLFREIPDGAFAGLKRLKLLNLTGNSMFKEVPTRALQPVPELSILLMDGLPLTRLRSYAVSGVNVAELSLSFLPRLRVVERSAFCNLTNLRSLQLHDNPRLMYIHPAAFVNLPLLRHLHLHNNGLIAVSGQLISALPSLVDLHLHHNPFYCDCNIYWLRRQLSVQLSSQHPYGNDAISVAHTTPALRTDDPTSVTNQASSLISEPQRVACYFPSGNSSMPLAQLPLEYFPPNCAPRVLPLFPATVNVTIGDELWLECQGLGVPTPTLFWILPSGQEVNSSQDYNATNFEVLQDSILHIKPVGQSDSGSYGCRAINSISEDVKNTFVRVQNKPLTISDVRLGNDFITFAWKGAIPRVQMSNFQLYYKDASQASTDSRSGFADYDFVGLHGSTHKYTLTGLRPMTTYHVCLVFKMTHPVQCGNYTTAPEAEALESDGIVRVSRSLVGVGLAVALGAALLIVGMVAARRAKRRKDYQGPLAGEEKASIPLDAVVHTVSSTPLTSSRTALLTNSQM